MVVNAHFRVFEVFADGGTKQFIAVSYMICCSNTVEILFAVDPDVGGVDTCTASCLLSQYSTYHTLKTA